MNIQQLLEKVKLRPAMYIGCFRLEPMFHFLNGFMFYKSISNNDDYVDTAFRNQFNNWVKTKLERKYKIELDNNMNYLTYINEVNQDDEQNLYIFFELCDTFFSELHSKNQKS